MSTACKARAMMAVMALLCSYCQVWSILCLLFLSKLTPGTENLCPGAQEKLPYHIDGVEGNDTIFPAEEEKAPCVELLNKALQVMLSRAE